jgi:hypothetical protein
MLRLVVSKKATAAIAVLLAVAATLSVSHFLLQRLARQEAQRLFNTVKTAQLGASSAQVLWWRLRFFAYSNSRTCNSLSSECWYNFVIRFPSANWRVESGISTRNGRLFSKAFVMSVGSKTAGFVERQQMEAGIAERCIAISRHPYYAPENPMGGPVFVVHFTPEATPEQKRHAAGINVRCLEEAACPEFADMMPDAYSDYWRDEMWFTVNHAALEKQHEEGIKGGPH